MLAWHWRSSWGRLVALFHGTVWTTLHMHSVVTVSRQGEIEGAHVSAVQRFSGVK